MNCDRSDKNQFGSKILNEIKEQCEKVYGWLTQLIMGIVLPRLILCRNNAKIVSLSHLACLIELTIDWFSHL